MGWRDLKAWNSACVILFLLLIIPSVYSSQESVVKSEIIIPDPGHENKIPRVEYETKRFPYPQPVLSKVLVFEKTKYKIFEMKKKIYIFNFSNDEEASNFLDKLKQKTISSDSFVDPKVEDVGQLRVYSRYSQIMQYQGSFFQLGNSVYYFRTSFERDKELEYIQSLLVEDTQKITTPNEAMTRDIFSIGTEIHKKVVNKLYELGFMDGSELSIADSTPPETHCPYEQCYLDFRKPEKEGVGFYSLRIDMTESSEILRIAYDYKLMKNITTREHAAKVIQSHREEPINLEEITYNFDDYDYGWEYPIESLYAVNGTTNCEFKQILLVYDDGTTEITGPYSFVVGKRLKQIYPVVK